MKPVDLKFLTVALLGAAAFGASASGQEMTSGQVKAFKSLPTPIYDVNGNRTGDVLEKADAPAPSGIAVRGWWPDKKMLLVQPDPDDSNVIYISYYALVMIDQAKWDAAMSATGTLVCAPRHTMRLAANSPLSQLSATKGFKNPC